MSLTSKLVGTLITMLVAYGLTFLAIPSTSFSLICSIAVGVVSLLNIVRTSRKKGKNTVFSDTRWNLYGSNIVFLVIVFAAAWLVRR